MKSLLSLGIGAAWSLSALSAATAPRAHACSIVATCSPPVRLFPTTDGIPGNLIYFKVLVADPGSLTLRSADGTTIPASVRTIGTDRVFAPDAELAGGQQIQLEYTTVCPAWVGAAVTPSRETFSFTTAPAVALDVPSDPALNLVDQGRTRSHPSAREITVGFVALSYDTTCTSCSAAHLTDTHFRVNGDGWGSQVGDQLDLLTGCEGLQISNSCTGEVLAPAGMYTVEARTTVVGAASQPALVSRTVELSCVLKDKSNGVVAPAAVRKYERPADEELDDGCSVHGSRPRAGAFTWAIAVVALASWRRRRFKPAV